MKRNPVSIVVSVAISLACIGQFLLPHPIGVWLVAVVLTSVLYLVGEGTGLAWAEVLNARKPGDSGVPPRNCLINSAVFYACVLCVFAVALNGCGKLPPIQWPKVAECADDIGGDLIGVVTRILLQDGAQAVLSERSKDEIAQVARDHGYGTTAVACMIDQLAHDWTSPGAAQEPTRVAAAARARAFLREVGTTTPNADSGGEQ